MYGKIHARVKSSVGAGDPIFPFRQRKQGSEVEILAHDFSVFGFCVFLPFNTLVAFQVFGVTSWQCLSLNLNNFPMCGLKVLGALCWLVEGPFREAKILVCTALGFGCFLLGNSSLLTDWKGKHSSQQGKACQITKSSGREQIHRSWHGGHDGSIGLGWGVGAGNVSSMWSWGLEEGVQRCMLGMEEGPVSEPERGGSCWPLYMPQALIMLAGWMLTDQTQAKP